MSLTNDVVKVYILSSRIILFLLIRKIKIDPNLEEFIISTFRDRVQSGTHIVQHTHDARRRLALNQITNDLVIKIINRFPFDSFLNILFLKTNNQKSK